MERAKEIELLSQCLELTRARQAFVTEAEEALVPVERYVDPVRFEEERDRLFRPSLNAVAHASQIASPGDFITRDVLGTPVILVRDADGSAKAFINVCRHRGATVELRERGKCRRFVCPYHAWTYETDGSLVVARQPRGFPTLDVERIALRELHCVEAGGLLFVRPDPHAPVAELDAATRAIIAELAWLGSPESTVYESSTRVWNANWKLIVDGGLESYHFKIAHRNTIAGFFPDNVSTFEFIGDHIRSILPRSSILTLTEQPRADWDIRKHTHMLYSIAPNASILVQERHIELILMTPLSVDQTRVEVATVAPMPSSGERSEKAEAYLAANHAFTSKTLDEDFEIAEQIQHGLRTGANEHFCFATFEGALTEWHRRLEARLGRG